MMAPAQPFGTFAGLPDRLSRGLTVPEPCSGGAVIDAAGTAASRSGRPGERRTSIHGEPAADGTTTTEWHALIGGPADLTPRRGSPNRPVSAKVCYEILASRPTTIGLEQQKNGMFRMKTTGMNYWRRDGWLEKKPLL